MPTWFNATLTAMQEHLDECREHATSCKDCQSIIFWLMEDHDINRIRAWEIEGR